MQIHLKHQPSYSLATARLDPNEEIRVESGAMVGYSDGITVETKSEGGLFGGLKRMVGGESFFQNIYRAPAQGGEILLAPALPGDMIVIPIRSGEPFYLQSGSFIASEKGVTTDTSWGGAKGFFGGAGLLLLKVTGEGEILAGCYGAIEERVLAAGQRFTVDTGHIVGFDGSVTFNIKTIGGWKSTILSGEGLVCELTGPGRVLMQSRSEEALIGYINAKLPRQSSSS
ncbi:MAG: TIGR00266 family protein [Chloroflexota bacterium]|nr:TIGR00266 family protein [Chloroflexota bacterium]